MTLSAPALNSIDIDDSIIADILNSDDTDAVLRVASVTSLLLRNAADIATIQQIREFFHNMLHAVWSQGGGTVTIDHVRRNHVTKLAFIDDGPSMRLAQLYELIGQLASSGGGVGDSRIGWGAKLTGLANNRCGIEYTIKTSSSSKAWRATLGVNEATGKFEWLKNADGLKYWAVEDEELPELIAKAGHGTMVVLLGNELREDTFSKACGLGNKNKVLARYINTRYASIPAAITVGARAKRKKSDLSGSDEASNPGDLRSKRVRGTLPALEAVAESGNSGTVRLRGGTVRWFYATSRDVSLRGYRDDVELRQIVSVCLADEEVPGLLESYDFRRGDAARRVLANFGLATVAPHVALVITPKGAQAEAKRTGLINSATKEPFSLDEMALQFKEKMPARLVELVDEACASKPLGDDARLRAALLRFPGLVKAKVLKSGQGAALLNRPGGVGGQNETGATEEGDKSRTQSATLKGGRGSGPGGRAAPSGTQAASALSDADLVAGLEFPQIVTVRKADYQSEPEKFDMAGWYFVDSNILHVNADWPGVDQELDVHLSGKKLVARDREAARNAVLSIIADRLCEPIIRLKIYSQTSAYWKDTTNLQAALEGDSLTAVALSSLSGGQEAARAITKAIGNGH